MAIAKARAWIHDLIDGRAAQHGGGKPPHRVRLPAGGSHNRRDGDAARPAKQSQHPRLLRARASVPAEILAFPTRPQLKRE